MDSLIQQQVKEETDLVCYAYAVAIAIGESDSLTEKGVTILRDCLNNGLSVQAAAVVLMDSDQN